MMIIYTVVLELLTIA